MAKGGHVYTFQSTPPRGRRLIVETSQQGSKSFNPRLRAGGDVIVLKYMGQKLVSIHASAREATSTR